MQLTPGQSILSIGDGSFLPLLAASNDVARSVTAIEENQHFRSILEAYAADNNLKNLTFFDDLSHLPDDYHVRTLYRRLILL